MSNIKIKTAERVVPMIYCYTTPGISYHDGYVKIGYTEQDVDTRIKQQTHTAGIKAKKEWQGTALYDDGSGESFKDYDFHAYLKRNDIEQPVDRNDENFAENDKNEWFYVSPADSRSMFFEFKANHGKLDESRKEVVEYVLRDEQAEAVEALSSERTGILSATTAFGKTVAAIGLIAKLQVNTLVLVHTKALLDQWKNELEKFLTIDFTPEETNQNRGRKKKSSPIGTLCSSGDSLHGLVDVVIMQSCFNNKEVKSFVRNYGMVIVDECHHVSAVSFEQILKNVIANHVYGLTATPIRKDGQQPIIFMQCGPVRYTADAKYQMKSQTFQRLLVLRFTSFRRIDEHNPAYTKVMPLLSKDQYRNEVIINDVRAVLEAKRSPIILTSLTEHVNILADMLRPYCKNVVTLIGSASTKEKRQNMERLNSIPAEEPFVIVATGKYVGEGFDYPRLDTLFMALPVSWKGIVAQYAGRLHREYNGKNEVEIYDYIDIHIPVCESMYRKRMKGYAAIGYSIKTEDALFRETINTSQVILDGKTFVRPFISSISKARKSILLSCPKIKMGKYSLIAERLRDIALNGITIIIFTETENEDIRKLQSYGFHVIIKPKNNFNCAIIDNTQIWYGSVNLLGYHSEEDNIITFNDAKVATEIINTLSP